MSNRKKTSMKKEAKVLIMSRRRCCICFGLNRDDNIKKGQIAHLDRNNENDDFDNLAFLCLEHHDEYDGKTSQSKGMTTDEVKVYREELYAHYGIWGEVGSHKNLLNFIASTIDLKQLAEVAVKVAGNVELYGKELAYEALTKKEFESCDGDLYVPYLIVLEHYASWGWLTFEKEEKEDEDGFIIVYITVNHKPICKEVAEFIRTNFSDEKDQ